MSTNEEVDAVVVGAGFAGLYAIYRLREQGLDVQAFERGDGVGGVWHWNRYPGARCDADSIYYSYSWCEDIQQEWTWTERFSSQAEIRAYLQTVADRYDLEKHIRFNTTVVGAEWDESTRRWTVRTDDGGAVSARFCVFASGMLSIAKEPEFDGLDTFEGQTYFTGDWPHEGVDFRGKRVAVIGTGSSGVQAIPIIAEQAEHLTVFQRTPNFTAPANNRPLDPEFMAETKAKYRELREQSRWTAAGTPAQAPNQGALDVSEEERNARYEERWQDGGPLILHSFNDLVRNLEANDTIANFVRGKIRQIVKDPEVADLLEPFDHPFGTKRICVGTDYYETYNRDNVTLVSVRKDPIVEFIPKGIRTVEHEYEFDIVVFATGYDAMTGALNRIDIRGRGGQPLKEVWAHGPVTYLGLQVAGFPNMFIVTGPGSPSVMSNNVTSIEQHVEWIADALKYLDAHGLATCEPDPDYQHRWVEHVNDVAAHTLLPLANSWYVGANVPGKPRVFMPYAAGVGNYRRKCDEVVANGYEGFVLSA